MGFLASGFRIFGSVLMGKGKAADRHRPQIPASSVSIAPQ